MTNTEINTALMNCVGLQRGWNGYESDPPSDTAIGWAFVVVLQLIEEDLRPTRIAPSAIGGVGITIRRNAIKVYIETDNDGEITGLVTNGDDVLYAKVFSPAGVDPIPKKVLDYLRD